MALAVLPAVVRQPPRGLGDADAHQQRDERRDGAERQDPPPVPAGEVDQGVSARHRDEVADIPTQQHGCHPCAATVRGDELGQHRPAERVLRADRDAQQDPEHEQLPRSVTKAWAPPMTTNAMRSIVNRFLRPNRSLSRPTSGAPKKRPMSDEAPINPSSTEVVFNSVLMEGNTTARMPRSKPSTPSPQAQVRVTRRRNRR